MSNPSQVRIVFFGSPEYVVPVLDALVKTHYEIVLVVTQPDRPMGRNRALTPTAIKTYAHKHDLLLSTPEQISDEVIDHVRSLRPTVCVLAAYGLILPEELLRIPRFGFINLHPSLLPRYRGATPVQAAILGGDAVTGISIMKMDKKMDHGPILHQETIDLSGRETAPELLTNLFSKGAHNLIATLPAYLSGKLKPEEQNHDSATFTKLLKKQHGTIHWNKTARYIERMTRAFNPWPGAYTTWNGLSLQIISARVFNENEKHNQVGLVVEEDNKILVTTACGYLELSRVKLAGKNEMLINDFVQGAQKFIGSILGS